MTDTYTGYRAPVTYGVTSTTPIRIAGSKDPPFRIINLETNGTVWLSENAGLKAGQGQPLRPGTSVLWVRPTELYAICESGVCQIILTTEIEDWQPDPAAIGIAVNTDHPVRLISTTMDTTPISVDVDQYQSIELTVSFSATTPNTLQIVFSDSTGAVLRRLQIQAGFTPLNSWRGTIPCHGTTMTLSLFTSTANVIAIGTLRRFTTMSQDVIDKNLLPSQFYAATDLWFDSGGTLATGNSYIATLPPWYGSMTCDVHFGCTAAMGTSHIRWDANPVGGAAYIFRRGAFTATPVANTFQYTDTAPCSGDAYRIIVVNASGVNFTGLNIKVCPTNGIGL